MYELQKQNLNTGQGLHNDWLWILMYVELTTEKYETFIQIDIRNQLFQLAAHNQHDVDTANRTLAGCVIHFTIRNSSSFKNRTKSTFGLEFLSLSSRREKLSIKFYQDYNNKDDSNIFRKMMCCLFNKLIASFRV